MQNVWRAAAYGVLGIALSVVPSLQAQARGCGPISSTEGTFPIAMGYRLGSPLWLSMYGGVWLDTNRNTPCETNTFIATAELGVAGAQGSLGFDHGSGRTPHKYGIWRTQASLLRTWGRPLTAHADDTFAGVELQYHRSIGGRVSMFWQIDNASERQRFMAASIILGW